MAVDYEIFGTMLPVIKVKLKPADKIFSSSGGMSWMTQNVVIEHKFGWWLEEDVSPCPLW